MDAPKTAEIPRLPEYKRLQRMAEVKLRRVFVAKAENNKPGVLIRSMTGARYLVQEDRSWKRIK